MTEPASASNRRILIVDDNPSIHEDFRKILCPQAGAGLDSLTSAEAALFGEEQVPTRTSFDLTSAHQGAEAVEKIREAIQKGEPFAVAFVDVRMPPGMDGIETTARLWQEDPDLQVVICSAYSDYSWDEMTQRLGNPDKLVMLKKPFDIIEVMQLSMALSEKWSLQQRLNVRLANLEQLVHERTAELESLNGQLSLQFDQQRQLTRALQEAQAKLNRFLAHSPAVLYSLRFENGRAVPEWVSENVTEITGLSTEQWFSQMPMLAHVDPADQKAVGLTMERLLEQHTASVTFRLRRPDGKVLWLHDDRLLRRDENGRPAEVAGCWTNVTDQRVLEEQLRQAQKMECVGNLAGGVAHDFNNLLMVIRGHADIMKALPDLPEPLGGPLQQIASAADRAANLTRQLLSFSRKQAMSVKHLDLNEVVADLTRMLRRMLGEAIEIRYDLASELPAVLGDQGMIEQVIVNLAVNARDAMPGGGALRISTVAQTISDADCERNPDSRPGRHIVLSVADEGHGIPPEVLPRLFEPFFTTKEQGKGTGLGLATVYGIVRQHEGWIEVQSEIGRGSCFQVFLPASGKCAVRAGDTKAIARPVPVGRETILVVEDETALRTMLGVSLKRQGYTVHSAVSGAAALEEWSERLGEIDLLITDIVMPEGTSGWDLAAAFRRVKPQIKVIYISGYNDKMTGRTSVIRDDERYLHKPFGVDQLAAFVRDYLDDGVSGQTPGTVPDSPAAAQMAANI